MSLATTGPNDAPLTTHDDGSDSGEEFGTGEADPPPTEPDTASDEFFGSGGADHDSDVRADVSPPDIAAAGELGGLAADKAEILGITQDEPLVEVVAEMTKTDTAPKDETPPDAEDLTDVGKVDALEMWDG
jgi:hypothetical protein